MMHLEFMEILFCPLLSLLPVKVIHWCTIFIPFFPLEVKVVYTFFSHFLKKKVDVVTGKVVFDESSSRVQTNMRQLQSGRCFFIHIPWNEEVLNLIPRLIFPPVSFSFGETLHSK